MNSPDTPMSLESPDIHVNIARRQPAMPAVTRCCRSAFSRLVRETAASASWAVRQALSRTFQCSSQPSLRFELGVYGAACPWFHRVRVFPQQSSVGGVCGRSDVLSAWSSKATTAFLVAANLTSTAESSRWVSGSLGPWHRRRSTQSLSCCFLAGGYSWL